MQSLFRILQLIAVLLLAAPLAAQQQPAAGEYGVKAAFLYNLTKFDWPPASFAQTEDRIRICIFGDDALAAVVSDTVAGERVNGRMLEVVAADTTSELQNCHIVYLNSSSEAGIRRVLEALRSGTALSVGETPRFAELGGMIAFSIEDNRLRFDANLQTIEQSQIRVSSRLLRLARTIFPRGGLGQ